MEKVDVWGRRRLSFEIDKKTEGIYAVVNFSAESATTDELDRQLGLSEAVMRTKVLRADTAVSQTGDSKRHYDAKAAKVQSQAEQSKATVQDSQSH